MLDRKFILENLEQVRQNCVNRNVVVDVDRFAELETKRRELQAESEDLNRRANEVSKTIGKAKDEAERNARKEEGKALREQKNEIDQKLISITEELDAIHMAIPNMTHPDAPIGEDDKANLELMRGATPIREFDFKPLDHVELAQKLDLIDFEAGARVAGAGFYFLKNEAVLLDFALQMYAMQTLIKEGFIPMSTPDLAKQSVLRGTGFNPRGNETQIYSISDTDLSLIATAEIPLGGMLSGEVVDSELLPLKFCGTSHCFRTEAGAAGKASRGLYRVHQFSKVEMFAFTLPEDSEQMLYHLRDMEMRIFDGLKIPYRVVDTSTGDLGGPAYRKFDLEAWMPGRGDFGEVTSTSNCTDYQARRLNARFKVKGEKGTKFLHTLNGTAIAISRGILSVMENYQQADGSIVVPDVLQPFMGMEVIKR
ncbi:MAG: serine--tRNA ligase [Planctomycetaceae bacterium]|nr:serine--tRNA ligase [Planctomycetaceae bacterium]